MKQLAAAGDLLPTDMILKEGTALWKPAGEARGLFPALKSETCDPPDHGGLAPKPAKPKHLDDDLDAIDLLHPYGQVQATVPPAPNPTGPKTIDEEQGVLILTADGSDLSFLSKLFCVHPLGFFAWVAFLGISLWLFDFVMTVKEAEFPRAARRAVEVVTPLVMIPVWFVIRAQEGNGAACPRCNALFSKMLISQETQVLGSREVMASYIDRTTIRDKYNQISGYLDVEKQAPSIQRKIRECRTCRCKAWLRSPPKSVRQAPRAYHGL